MDGTAYTSSTIYGGGEQVVYNGFSNSVKVTGLTENTTYWFRVYEYNNQGTAYTRYFTATSSNNPLSQTTTALQVPPQVMISQVYEGAGSDKWIEITNIGTTTVDLGASDLSVVQYNQSGDSGVGTISGDPSYTVDLSGSLASGVSLLIRNTSAVNPTYATAAFSNGGVNSFNGNDAIALMINSSTIMDAFGDGDGINYKDKSYHRHFSVNSPNAAFTSSEWVETTLTDVENATVLMSQRLGVHSYMGNLLPVSLIFFDAKPAGSQVNLTWATASEKDNDRFEVQRSSNGESFTTIATVAGKGITQQTTNYTAIDENPLKGLTYYRLKQVDVDGTTSYSKIVAVNTRTDKAAFVVYPNPAGNTLSVSFTSNAESVSVLNMLGQEVLNQKLTGTENRAELNIAALPGGAYQVIVTSETGRGTQKFVKITQ